jgi:hypothetical protein
MSYTRAKCARESCTRRGEERNKMIVPTPHGNFIVYLCNACCREYSEATKRKPQETGRH